jgi:hypothetical protein
LEPEGGGVENDPVNEVVFSLSRSHRNLRTGTCVFAPAQQIFGGKTPCKKSANLPLDKVIYFKVAIFQGSTKPLFTTQTWAESS